jgi:large subunit ribosomal protein L25
MEELTLQVEMRKEVGGKGQLTASRASQKIPAVIYGGDKTAVSIFVAEKDLVKVRGTGKTNAIITLKHDKGTDTVLLKEVQRHPISRAFLHVDFQRISLKKEIEVKVAIKVVGEAPGVKLHGGIMEYVLRELEVKCLPTSIPDSIKVDVSHADIGHAIHVKDIPAMEGVTILTSPEQVLITVTAPKAEEAPAAETAAAGTEPEISVAKGKKDEEGAEGEKGKAAAPAAEKGKEAAPKK